MRLYPIVRFCGSLVSGDPKPALIVLSTTKLIHVDQTQEFKRSRDKNLPGRQEHTLDSF